MIFKKKKFNFGISFLCVLLGLAIILFDNILNFILYFFCVLIHEFAHHFVASKLGYNLKNFYLMPYGVCLNYQENIFTNNDEILIAIAGPLANYLLVIICIAIWWLFPETYYYLNYFCFCNLILAVFNTLPCFPLDGGRVLTALLSKKITREKAYKITIFLNFIFSILLVINFVVSIFSSINFSFIFIAIFLFSGLINPNKYSNYSYLSLTTNKKNLYKKGCSVNIFAVSSSVLLYKIISKFSKYKYNVIYVIFNDGSVRVLSETNINNLAIKYSPSYSIDEIVNFSK